MNRIISIAAALLLGCVASAQELTIERLAPENTMFIAGVKNCSATYQRWTKTTLPRLMEIDAIKKTEEEAMGAAPELDRYERIIEEALKELGIEEDPAKITPQGAMGLAVYLHTNEEDASRVPGVFVFADFGDNAERVQTIIDRLLTEADEDPNLSYEMEDVMGRKVYSFQRNEENQEEVDEALDEFDPGMDLGPMIPMPGINEFFSNMDQVHFSRDGNVFFAASQLQQLTDVFDMLDKKTGTPFADTDDFQGARALLGEGDGFGMVFLRPVFQLMAEEDPTFAMSQGMINTLIGDIKALAFGVQLDGSKSMIEGSLAAYMPHGKSGITALLDRPSGRAPLPPFIGTNAVTFSSVNLDMGGVGKLVQQFVTGNPMLQAEAGEMMPEIEKLLDTISTTLSDRLYTSMTLDRPVTPESMGTLVAIVCKDAQKFEAGISELVTGFGFQPRDFLGQRIYGMDPEMVQMMEIPGGGPGIGIGGGYVFIGQQNSIELALRTTLQSGAPTLAGEDMYQRAVDTLAGDGLVAWGYLDPVQMAEAQMTSARMQREQMIEQMKEWNPEFAEEIASEPDPTRHWNEDSFRELRQLIGPMAWQVRSTERGFIANVFQHRGEAAAE